MTKLSSIAKHFGILCVLLLAMLTLSASVVLADPPPGSGEVAHKPPWMIYGNRADQMHILIETDTGVDSDTKHIKIKFDQSGVSCSRDYHTMDIKLLADRRLWTFSCSGFQPNKTYDYTISFTDHGDDWTSFIGWFRTPPNDHAARKLSFYGYGDTRMYVQEPDNDNPINKVAHAMVQHHNNNGNAGAFLLHTGDIVPNGGKVAHWEVKDGHTYEYRRVDPWSDQFFIVGKRMQDMLAQLPIFTTIGNHDFTTDDDPDPYFYHRYFQYPMYDDHGDDNHGYYRIGWDLNDLSGEASSWTEPYQIPGWYGDSSAGGGITVGDINGNTIPDLIAFHINNPGGGNSGYYRIGWDVHPDTGYASSWTEHYQIPGWYGDHSDGGGISVGDINGNDIPDLIAFHINNHDGGNHGYYRIGWDVDPDTGQASSWTDHYRVPNTYADRNQGGGISVGDINGNTAPDLITFHIDKHDGGNRGYYHIGWDVDADTGQASSWSKSYRIPGWYGGSNQGGGISVGVINEGNTIPDLVAFHVDNPSGENHGYYRIGWDVDPDTGQASSWTDPQGIPGWYGGSSSGGGITVGDINGNGIPDISAFHLDDHRHHFDSDNLGDYYYEFWWGPAIFYSITTYPMDGYCKYSHPVVPGEGQYDWLRTRLQHNAYDKRPWKIVFMHAPPYDASRSCNQQQVRDYLQPLFEEYGVDVVIAGHEHYYARKEVNDIQYLVLGGGGANLEGASHPGDVDFYKLKYGFNYFEIDGDTMTITAIDEKGEEFDSLTISKPPVADFTFSIYGGAAPLAVQFQDKSTGHVSGWKWEWDFGDGKKATVQNPTHMYAESGTYQVSLTVRSPWNTSTKTLDVTITNWAAFTAEPRSGPAPLTVTFTPDQAFSYSHWKFGDGAELQQPGTVHHTYLTSGTFSVTHISGEDANNTMTEIKHDYITVGPNADNDLILVEPVVIYPPSIDR